MGANAAENTNLRLKAVLDELAVKMPAAKTAKKLAYAGVNIELFAPVEYTDGKATIAIGVDKIEEAKRKKNLLIARQRRAQCRTR